jgi:hypothetical protein
MFDLSPNWRQFEKKRRNSRGFTYNLQRIKGILAVLLVPNLITIYPQDIYQQAPQADRFLTR